MSSFTCGPQNCDVASWPQVPARPRITRHGVGMQVTTEGLNAILVHRKATLQHFSIPVQRPPTLNMRDWIWTAGGAGFMGVIRQIRQGNDSLEQMLQYLRLGATSTTFVFSLEG